MTTKRRRHKTSNQTASHSIPYIHTHTPTNAHRCGVSTTLNPNSHRPTCPAQTKPWPNPRWAAATERTDSGCRATPPTDAQGQHRGTSSEKETQKLNAHKTADGQKQAEMRADCSPEVQRAKLAVDPDRGHLVHLGMCVSGGMCGKAWEASNVECRGSVGGEACETTE